MKFSRHHYRPSSEMQRETVEQLRNASRRLNWRIRWARHELKEARERMNKWRQ